MSWNSSATCWTSKRNVANERQFYRAYENNSLGEELQGGEAPLILLQAL